MLTDTSLCFFFFFFQCLKQYVELLIKEGLETAISCPDAACPKQGHLQEDEARAPEQTRFLTCARVPCLASPCVVGSRWADLCCVSSPPSACYTSYLYFFLLRLSAWLQQKLCKDTKSYNLKEVGTPACYPLTDSCGGVQIPRGGECF